MWDPPTPGSTRSGPRGRLRWRFKTGEIIDSAATIGRYDPRLRTSPITVGSGDESLYRLRSDRGSLSRARRVIWTYRSPRGPATGQLVNWWEGNAVTGFGGVIYAGNTGGGGYAINPDGSERWVFPTQNSVWTAPAITRDGRTFWASLDLGIYGVDPQGRAAVGVHGARLQRLLARAQPRRVHHLRGLVRQQPLRA